MINRNIFCKSGSVGQFIRVQSSRPLDAINSTQQGRHTTAMPAVATTTVVNCYKVNTNITMSSLCLKMIRNDTLSLVVS